jgi:hypothetical protein
MLECCWVRFMDFIDVKLCIVNCTLIRNTSRLLFVFLYSWGNRLSTSFNCPFLFFVPSSFLLTDIARSIQVEYTKYISAKFLGSSSWIELFVDVDKLFLTESSTWTVLLQTNETRRMTFYVTHLSNVSLAQFVYKST